MTEERAREAAPRDVDLMVAEIETGARDPAGFAGRFIAGLCLAWSIFQLYIASNLPFMLQEWTGWRRFVFNNVDARQVHLAFALSLAMLTYPLLRTSPRDRIPLSDWILAGLAVVSCLYMLVFKDQLAERAGLPTTTDLAIATLGMVLLGVAVFRSLGLPLLIVASVFVLYVLFGDADWLPDAIRWKGASVGKALWHYWMQTEGVFGVALGVSASMIFLFVLFGALLERAGAGNYFIQMAFAALGHLRGGPAKAAVVASALSGLYSGSSIANVVTTGTFTIPLMKKTGFAPEKAGAVEVASSTNGQLTPPVMGAAAFLISEFTGVPYTDLIIHAALPALVSYIALVYIVHLEALKLGLKGLPKPSRTMRVASQLAAVLFGFLGMIVLGAALYWGLGWIRVAFPGLGWEAAVAIFLIAYLVTIRIAARHPDLEVDDPDAPIRALPRFGDVAVTGLHYILPIVILIWNIMIERLSPALSAYWATLAMLFILFTQDVLKAFFRGESDWPDRLRQGWSGVIEGMISGARNMIGIGVATGAAGIIVGTVSLTGAHQVIGGFVEALSGGSIMVMLLLVAVMSLILGMGLPTTANYIVVSSLMAPVIVTVGAQNGLVVPLVAVHLFVFYFGILADDTPPVGLAAFAAAAIAGGDPIRTGVQGFMYDIRTAILPFLFIFNTELLLIDVGPLKAIYVFVIAAAAMMIFAAATQGYFLTRNRLWEGAALLLVAFTLMRPGAWLDLVEPPYEARPGSEILALAGSLPEGEALRIVIEGPDFDDPDRMTRMVIVPRLPAGETGEARLAELGLMVRIEDGRAVLDEPMPGTSYFTTLQGFDFYADRPVEIVRVEVPVERMPKELFHIPALLLLLIVVAAQRRRQTVPAF